MSEERIRKEKLSQLVEDLGEFYDSVTVVATVGGRGGVRMEYATSGGYYESMGVVSDYLRIRRTEGEVVPVEIVSDRTDDDNEEWRGEPDF